MSRPDPIAETNMLDTTPRVEHRGFLRHAVWIPMDELAERIYELPDKDSVVGVGGARVEETLRWFASGGRRAGPIQETGSRVPKSPRCRLWRPSPLVASLAAGTVLDIGCGTGRNAVYLASEGADVVAVDILPDAIDRARKLEARYAGLMPAIDFVEADFDEWNPSCSFEAVLMIRSFRPSFLPRARELLAPGGRLVVEAFAGGRRRNVATFDDLRTFTRGLRVEHEWSDGNLIQFVATVD